MQVYIWNVVKHVISPKIACNMYSVLWYNYICLAAAMFLVKIYKETLLVKQLNGVLSHYFRLPQSLRPQGLCEWCVLRSTLNWGEGLTVLCSLRLEQRGQRQDLDFVFLCVLSHCHVLNMQHVSCYSKKIKVHVFLFVCLVIKCNSPTAAIFPCSHSEDLYRNCVKWSKTLYSLHATTQQVHVGQIF